MELQNPTSTRNRVLRRGNIEMAFLGAFASFAVVAAAPSGRFSAVNNYPLPGLDTRTRKWRQGAFTEFRGGSSDPSIPNAPYLSQDYEQQQQQQQPRQDYLPEQPPPNTGDESVPFREPFQERVDTWRNNQIEQAAQQRASSFSPRDEKGRMKLFVSVSKASRSLTFFFLMWRNVHLYEVCDQKFKGNLRLLGVLPLTILFVANMAGVVASITSPGHASKKRLKAILNLDKLMEACLIIYYIGKLLFSTSRLVPREIYVSHILHSVFFILQCHTVTRFVWDESLPVATSGMPNQVQEEFGDYDEPMIVEQQYGVGTNNDNRFDQSPYRY